MAELGLPPHRLPEVRWNERLRTVAGRYLGGANLIELNPHYCLQFGLVEVIATVRHEVCHLGPRFGTTLRHRTELFARRLERLGAPKHCLPLPGKIRRSRVRYRYQCPSCGRTQIYRRRIRSYACRACCDRLNAGRYDPRFRLRLEAETEIPLRRRSPAPALGEQLPLLA